MQLLFSLAACGTPSVELEAVMALRGLAQQYCGALEGQGDRVARVAEGGAGVAVQMVPPSPRSQQGGCQYRVVGGGTARWVKIQQLGPVVLFFLPFVLDCTWYSPPRRDCAVGTL